MTKKFRFMTRLLAAVLAVVMLSSAIYIAVEADHDCSGEDCAICHQIGVCENLLKSLGLAGAAAAITAAFTYTMCKAILPCTEMIGTLTLVSLKVKLSTYNRTFTRAKSIRFRIGSCGFAAALVFLRLFFKNSEILSV